MIFLFFIFLYKQVYPTVTSFQSSKRRHSRSEKTDLILCLLPAFTHPFQLKLVFFIIHKLVQIQYFSYSVENQKIMTQSGTKTKVLMPEINRFSTSTVVFEKPFSSETIHQNTCVPVLARNRPIHNTQPLIKNYFCALEKPGLDVAAATVHLSKINLKIPFKTKLEGVPIGCNTNAKFYHYDSINEWDT